jgi:hypothetical protein
MKAVIAAITILQAHLNSQDVMKQKAWNSPLDTPENEKAGLHGKPAFK